MGLKFLWYMYSRIKLRLFVGIDIEALDLIHNIFNFA